MKIHRKTGRVLNLTLNHKTSKNKSQIFKLAKREIESGNVIIVQTDTVVGLAVDARCTECIQKMNELKQIHERKVRQITLGSVFDITKYCKVDDLLLSKLQQLLPGPYTFVLEAREDYSLSNLTLNQVSIEEQIDEKRAKREINTVGVRVPNAPTLLDFVDYVGFPLATTSANITGEPAVVDINEVDKRIWEKVGVIIPDMTNEIEPEGAKDKKVESSGQMPSLASAVIDLTIPGKPRLIRDHPKAGLALKILSSN